MSRSREGTPKKAAPKDKILKDKPDNRFSPIVKSASPRVSKASPAEKLVVSLGTLFLPSSAFVWLESLLVMPHHSLLAKSDIENRLNGSPSNSPKVVPRAQTTGSMPRKALAVLGSTPPKHPVNASPAKTFSPFWQDVDPHDDKGNTNDEIDSLVNPTLGGSAHLRLRSSTF